MTPENGKVLISKYQSERVLGSALRESGIGQVLREHCRGAKSLVLIEISLSVTADPNRPPGAKCSDTQRNGTREWKSAN